MKQASAELWLEFRRLLAARLLMWTLRVQPAETIDDLNAIQAMSLVARAMSGDSFVFMRDPREQGRRP